MGVVGTSAFFNRANIFQTTPSFHSAFPTVSINTEIQVQVHRSKKITHVSLIEQLVPPQFALQLSYFGEHPGH